MRGSLTRRFYTVALTAAVAVAYVQVTSVDPPASRPTSYTLRSAVDEVRNDVRVTFARLRQERDERKAILVRMSYDMRVLNQTLTQGNPQGFGR